MAYDSHTRCVGALWRMVSVVALVPGVCSTLAAAPTIHASAGVSPASPRPGEAFELTVHVLEWSTGGSGGSQALSAATIAWPEWTQLGLTVTAVPSSSARASTVADNPALATSLMVGLQAAAARTVTIPAIRVQGTSGSAATEPLLVVIETSAPAAQPAVLVQPVGPQVRPGQLPFGPGPTPVPAAPSAGPPAQTVADNDRAGRLQMAIGAAAFYVLVAVVALVACRSWRRRAGRPPE